MPANFKKLLEDKFRDYGESETHRQAYVYFATRILPAVNTSFNKFDKSKYKRKLSECFSCTDEAFALLLVINYEARWQSQHEALMKYPLESPRYRERRWKESKYTSGAQGRRGVDLRRKYNRLCGMVKEQREREETGDTVERYLRNVYREEAGIQAWEDIGMRQTKGQHGVVEEDDEVESMVECDINQI